MLADFVMCADIVVRTSSSSALAVGSRRGLGRPRHVQRRAHQARTAADIVGVRVQRRAFAPDQRRCEV